MTLTGAQYTEDNRPHSLAEFEQIVLVLQGGGALGAYQAGVYAALSEAGILPDWVIGTSIGAINGAIIAGNPPATRVERLREFWEQVEYEWPLAIARTLPFVGQQAANWLTIFGGNPEFFRPNPIAAIEPQAKLGPAQAAFYSVEPLRATLSGLVSDDRIDGDPTRLTIGAARITDSKMVYFDSAHIPIGIDHVLASGALPPAFPAVRVGDDWFWDGGVMSNTPLEVVFTENPRRHSLIFEVQLWNPNGAPPESIWEVLSRYKDIQYSSRSELAVERAKQAHRFRHIIRALGKRLPAEMQADPHVREMMSWGCDTTMHIVRLLAPTLEHEDYAKDIDFSPSGIEARWHAGLTDTRAVLAQAPWEHDPDRNEGVVVHETQAGRMMETR